LDFLDLGRFTFWSKQIELVEILLNKSKLALFSRAQPRSFLPPAGRRAHVQPTHAAPLPCSRGICPTGHRLHRSHALSAASPPMPSSSVWHDRARAPPLLLPLCCAPEPTPLIFFPDAARAPFLFPLRSNHQLPVPGAAPRHRTAPASELTVRGEPRQSAASVRPRHPELL
jgi:hypothetical protein